MDMASELSELVFVCPTFSRNLLGRFSLITDSLQCGYIPISVPSFPFDHTPIVMLHQAMSLRFIIFVVLWSWYELVKFIVNCVNFIEGPSPIIYSCMVFLSHFRSHFFTPVEDTLDNILAGSDEEEESEAIVGQVLDEIGIEIGSKVGSFCNYLFVLFAHCINTLNSLHIPTYG